MKCTIKKDKTNSNNYNLSFKRLTLGEICAMKNALFVYSVSGSPVAQDVLAYLSNGAAEANLEID